jgi:hypothetical protein
VPPPFDLTEFAKGSQEVSRFVGPLFALRHPILDDLPASALLSAYLPRLFVPD